ncbi:MAG: hypothetical protein AB200_02505 [Parcubacteria bacterium C7867-005]|nr:MAG: hypothetical protein AB200_02505 [Parcubacteria bacterium C7867-005]
MKKQKGFTFIEIVVGVAVFLVFAVGVYQGYTAAYKSIGSSHTKSLAADLANEHFEMIKNMPYSTVGLIGGNPSGLVTAVQTAVRDGATFTLTTDIRNVDDPFDSVSPTDPFPADYKLVEVVITCTGCKNFTPVSVNTLVAPKNLES